MGTKKIFKIINYFLIFTIVFPFIVQAAGLVPCGGENEPECTLCHLFEFIKKILDLIFEKIAPWILIIIFFYGGFLWLFSGGKEETIKRGQTLIMNAIIGFVIVFCAWLIVNTLFWIIAQLGGDPGYQSNWFKFECQY